MPEMVKTVNAVKKFGAFKAVDHVNLSVERGEIFGFLGANGAGKTTMIRILCGLLEITSGEAWVAGFSVRKDRKEIRKRIGYMSQKFSLYDDLTIRENLEFYGGVYGLTKSEIKKKSQELIERLKLEKMAKRLTGELPLGFKQRLALGGALLHDPEIVFLDEPTSGVDPRVRRDFWREIQSIAKQNKTIFVTTHFMDEAEYCNRVSIMHRGSVIAEGSPVKLKKAREKNNMEDVFVELLKEKRDE